MQALKREYVRIYRAFAEVRGWRADAPPPLVLSGHAASLTPY